MSFPNSTVFINEQTGATTGYFSIAEQNIIPACRITPSSAREVSTIVKAVSDLNCKFAIRGGGHMIWAGAANILDGVTIDLSQMNDICVAKDRKVLSAGPGCRWQDIYNRLDPMGLAVVGGRVGTVGIGGLTIGGEAICQISRI